MELDGCNQSDFFINGTPYTAESKIPETSDDQLPHTFYDDAALPLYLRITCLILFVVIFTVGTVGNIMVTLVISCSRDMRTSTNIFLVNLSIADLLVLVVCTPTALIEVTYHPDRWVLGFYMCKFVPLLETTVANTSVLTILAISFERYYAICRPLKANYICTKSRAAMICLAAWVLATIITSPMIFMITYVEGENECGEWTARCYVTAGKTWPDAYTISTIFLFFLVPFFILLVTYGMIAKRLTTDRSALNAKNENHKARKQVVLMLGTVVFAFFLCLLPFRVLTLFVLLADTKFLEEHAEAYQNFIYFSRMMIYINSSLNPILYNIMSSKFRNGFLRLCNRRRKQSPFTRTGTFITNTTTNSTTMSINLGHQPAGNGNCSGVTAYGKCNGHSTGHNSLGHCTSLKKNVSPSSRPDLLKTLIRSQSNGATTASTNVSASMCNPQCIHYYNNHTCGNGIRHIGGNALNNSIPMTNTNGRSPTATMKPQSHPNFASNGTNGVGVKASTNIYNNIDCMNVPKPLKALPMSYPKISVLPASTARNAYQAVSAYRVPIPSIRLRQRESETNLSLYRDGIFNVEYAYNSDDRTSSGMLTLIVTSHIDILTE